ncbi:MAG: hypothetical protein Q9170_000491 [Blastenia crenularia]
MASDQFDSALDLLRRLPPHSTSANLHRICTLAPDLTEDLLSSVDQPLQTRQCKKTKRDYLLCDYNRDGDSYRSPWSNEFEPEVEDAEMPSERVRKMEVRMGEAVEVYRELYYEGGVSSVYFWDLDDGFAGVVLLKKTTPKSSSEGGWDSIHVFEAIDRARTAHYKLTSTVILHLNTRNEALGTMDLSGNMTRQIEQDMPVQDDGSHIVNVGKLVEDMELKMRNLLQEVYFGKAKDIVGDLRSIQPLTEAHKDKAQQQEMINSMKRYEHKAAQDPWRHADVGGMRQKRLCFWIGDFQSGLLRLAVIPKLEYSRGNGDHAAPVSAKVVAPADGVSLNLRRDLGRLAPPNRPPYIIFIPHPKKLSNSSPNPVNNLLVTIYDPFVGETWSRCNGICATWRYIDPHYMATRGRSAKKIESDKGNLPNQNAKSVQTDDLTENMVSWFTSPFKKPSKARNATSSALSQPSLQYNEEKIGRTSLANSPRQPVAVASNFQQNKLADRSAPSIEVRESPFDSGNNDPTTMVGTSMATYALWDGSPNAAAQAAEHSDETSRMGSTASKSSAPSSHTSLGYSFVKAEPKDNENLLHRLERRAVSSSPLSSQLSPAKSTTPSDLGPPKMEAPAKAAKTSPRAKRIQFSELRPRTSIPQALSSSELAHQSIHAAFASRLNPFAMHPDELRLLRNHICQQHVTAYLNIRNRILRLWVRNPLVGVTPEEAAGCAASSRWLNLAEIAYEWLLRNGYINFGCVEVPDTSHLRVKRYKPRRSRRKTIVVIGAGMAGLGCARQLESLFGQYDYRLSLVGEEPPKVIILEGRSRIGGRVYSHSLRNQDSAGIPEHARCTAEMGAHIITGFDHGNPLNMIIRGQLALHYHALRDNSTLYDSDGRLVDKGQDSMVEKLYNDILDRASIYRHRPVIPPSIQGDKTLIEAGRDPLGESGTSISAVQSTQPEEPVRASSDQLENVPGGMDKLTGKAHMVTGSRKKAAPALAAEAMGWHLASNVLASRDLNLDAVARGMVYPTLGAAMDEAVKQYQFLLDLSPQDMRLINWHYANMEYANAVNLGKLSLSGWDQDSGNEFEGEHAQVVGGYQQVPRGILQYPTPLDLHTRKSVKKISYDADGRRKGIARILCDDGQSIDADQIILTTPLGVLKEESLIFDPPLPKWKLAPINRLGFGTLNKIVLVYDRPFWDIDQDMFGLLREPDMANSLDQEDYVKNRGKFYLFWNCIKTSGRPVLIALLAGEAAVQAENTRDADLVAGVTKELRRMFSDNQVPMPSETIVTRWGKDRFARGTYSYVGATSLPGDYDVMARPVGNLHFAGEATCGTHPATVHGAYISGLRAASEIIEEMLGPIDVPTPLVPAASKVDSSPQVAGQKRKAEEAVVGETEAAKTMRLEKIEQDILKNIFGEIGLQPADPGSKKGSNPFLLFTTDKWDECKENICEKRRVDTGNSNIKVNKNEIRTALGQMWQRESEETKQKYRETTSSNKVAYNESAATFVARLTSWNERALEIRRKYIEEHPDALSVEEEQSMWTALGVFDSGRKAKMMSKYAERAGRSVKMEIASSPSGGSSISKKDPNTPPLTPLEKHLLDAGPIRNDGSDKFFGMENCLYFSVPFREQVLNYPKRSPLASVLSTPNGLPRIHTNPNISSNPQSPISPTKPKLPVSATARNPGVPIAGQKPEDKESSDYKKKQATAKGPVLYMNYDNAPAYGMEESLFSSMKDIFEAVIAHKSHIGIVSPAKFLEILKRENEMFRSAMHQDAHEFLNLVLNEVVENVEVNAKKIEANRVAEGVVEARSFEQALATAMPQMSGTRRSGNTRWVHELFEGTLTSETKCLTCENISQRDETFLDLSVDLDQHSSVTSCLRKFSEEEMLCERNKFHCDRCGGLQEAEKRMKIKRLPRILALHLKRFKYTEDLQRLQKLFHRVVYPYHLRLFNTTDDAEDPDRLYELYAVVVHIGGGPYHGHYVSIIKTEDRGWLLFDDELVEPVDKSYVRNFFGDRPGLACAYVLFYQETTTEKVKREFEAEGQPAAAAAETQSEAQGLGLGTNGIFTNGLHHVQSAMSPTSDSHDRLEDLDRSATEPPLPVQPNVDETTALPPIPRHLSATPHTHDNELLSRKERKAADKEKEKADKADKARFKEVRKSSNLDEDHKIIDGAVRESNPSALSRFRQTSKSISKKPKFWTSKETKNGSETIGESENTIPTPDKTEKPKNRFSSLRKKTSSMLFVHSSASTEYFPSLRSRELS